MIDLDLEAIKARVETATPGPWNLGEWNPKDNPGGYHTIVDWGSLFPAASVWTAPPAEPSPFDDEFDDWEQETVLANSTFIAHARTDVPALIAEIEHLRDIVAGLVEA